MQDFYFGYIGLAIGIVLAIILLSHSFVMVPQGYQYTIERFGRFTGLLEPGLTFLIPFVDRVGQQVDTREMCIDIPPQLIISKENANVTIDALCFVKVVDVARSVYAVQNIHYAVTNLALTNVRTVLGSLELDQMLSQRELINVRLLSVINEATAPWGIQTTRVEIKDIQPPKEIVHAMHGQIKAERNKRSEILEAEGNKRAQILRAEGDKEARMQAAEAQKYEQEKAAEARVKGAEAEAQATRMLSEAIQQGSADAVQYLIAEKYTAALAQIGSASSSKLVMMPLEASSLVGSLSGIKALLAPMTETAAV